jgi:hypothetical protein
MNATPTMPSPTTTTFLRCDGGLGCLSDSFSSSVRAFGGSLLIAMPGDEVAHDICVLELAHECEYRRCNNLQEGKSKASQDNENCDIRKFGGMIFPRSNMPGKKTLRGEIVDDEPISRSTASSDRTGLSDPLQLSAKSFKGQGRRSIGRKDQNVHISADRATSGTHPFSVEACVQSISRRIKSGFTQIDKVAGRGLGCRRDKSFDAKLHLDDVDHFRNRLASICINLYHFLCIVSFDSVCTTSYPRRSSPSGRAV